MSDEHSLETLTAEDFRSSQGTRFRLTGGPPESGSPVSVDVELVDVTEHAAPAPGAFRAPFSLLFHGPLRPAMPQGMYRLEHDHVGTLELFIVPVDPNRIPLPGRAPTAMYYEAVFG